LSKSVIFKLIIHQPGFLYPGGVAGFLNQARVAVPAVVRKQAMVGGWLM
jgi:hypothetical protein